MLNEEVRLIKAHLKGAVEGCQSFLDVRVSNDGAYKRIDEEAKIRMATYKKVLKFIEDEISN